MRVCLHCSCSPLKSARLADAIRTPMLPLLVLPAFFFTVLPPTTTHASNAGKSPVVNKVEKTGNASIPPAIGATGPFDEAPLPIDSRCPLNEFDRDRLHALALFSTGRALEQKGRLSDALRRYERAQRYDPDSRTIVQTVVELAKRLGRTHECDRYLYRLVKLGGGDPIDVEELAFRTAMGGEFARSIEIYRQLLETRKGKPHEPIDVVMRWRLSEIHFMADKYKEAADCAAWVIDALENPKKYGLDEKLVGRLLSGPHPPFDLFGEYFLQADQPQKAKAMFEKANKATPDKKLLEYRLARVDARAGRNEQALQRLESCLAEPTENTEKPTQAKSALQEEGLVPYKLLDEILKTLDKENELIPRLEKLHAATPKNIMTGYALADAYRESSKLDKAEKLYKSLLVKHPAAVAYAGLIDIYRKQNRMDSLLELLSNAVEQSASLEPVGSLVREVAEQNTKPNKQSLLDRIAETARQSEKKDPKAASSADAFLAVALLALDAKRYELTDEFFRKAIKANPQEAAEMIMIWSIGLLADDRNAQAAEVLHQGFEQKLLAEDDPIPYYYQATALAMIDKLDEAIAAAKKAVALKSDSPRFAAQQGWVFYRAKQYDRAAEIHEDILKRFDSDWKNQDLRETLRGVRLALAGIEVNRSNSSRAEELLEEILDEFPDDVSAMNDLSFLWADENRHLHRALRMSKKAVGAEPKNAAYLDSLGWALFRLGKHKEAAVELEKAVAIDPQEPEILEHLAEVYDSLKKHQKAKDCRRRAKDNKK
ncbi:MAG: tetratricopeptide repeat protein [Pirellulales bacterium]|nr:tetratricopeptide repeat protein [Pirellulales bacterium]